MNKANRGNYHRDYARKKQAEKGWVNHSWDHIDDVCLRCGLKRHRIAVIRKPGVFIDEYLVNGKWTKDHPKCLAGEQP